MALRFVDIAGFVNQLFYVPAIKWPGHIVLSKFRNKTIVITFYRYALRYGFDIWYVGV